MDQDQPTYSFEKEETEIKQEGFAKPADFNSYDDMNESPLGFLSNKMTSLIIGILVIALVVPFLIFTLSKSKKTNTKSATTQVSKNVVTPTPSTNKTAAKNTAGTKTTSSFPNTTKGGLSVATLGTKTYNDPVFGYALNIPSSWEAIKNAGNGNAYQMAFHPVGSLDKPFTIGAQSGISETTWINTVYGANYPRENASIAGRNAILVRRPSYISYYTHDNTYVYEISEALGKPEYNITFQSMLSSLSFTK